jgi:hypothetical protein
MASKIDRSALADGVLLFSLSFITLGIEERALNLFGHEIYTVPDWIYTAVGTVSGIVSILLLAAAFNKQLAYRINSFIDGSFGVCYWSVFWFAYTASWVKGLSIVPQGEFIFYLVVFLGTVWFIIVTLKWIKSIVKYCKWFIGFSRRNR